MCCRCGRSASPAWCRCRSSSTCGTSPASCGNAVACSSREDCWRCRLRTGRCSRRGSGGREADQSLPRRRVRRRAGGRDAEGRRFRGRRCSVCITGRSLATGRRRTDRSSTPMWRPYSVTSAGRPSCWFRFPRLTAADFAIGPAEGGQAISSVSGGARVAEAADDGAAATGGAAGIVRAGVAQPPALVDPPRSLAGGRGVALPGVGDQLPAGARRAGSAGRRGAPEPAHPGRHPGAWRRNSTIRTRCGSVRPGSASGRPAARSWPATPMATCGCSPATSFSRPPGRPRHIADAARWPGSLRRLADAGAVELLGGPATHPFQPLYPDDVVRGDCSWGWRMRRCGSGVRRQVSGHRSADTAQGLKTCTPSSASDTSWSTARLSSTSGATLGGRRVGSRTWWRSRATSRSPIASGRPRRVSVRSPLSRLPRHPSRLRIPTVASHEHLDDVGSEGALPASRHCRGGGSRCRRFRLGGGRAADQIAAAAGPGLVVAACDTGCSGTGGMRVRGGWRRCCARCRRLAWSW